MDRPGGFWKECPGGARPCDPQRACDGIHDETHKLIAGRQLAKFRRCEPGLMPEGDADLEGLEFESEAGKSSELRPIGNPANALAPGGGGDSVGGGGARTAIVGADSRKVLVKDSLFSGEDEACAFRRAVSL